jgi:hypothetical protein
MKAKSETIQFVCRALFYAAAQGDATLWRVRDFTRADLLLVQADHAIAAFSSKRCSLSV